MSLCAYEMQLEIPMGNEVDIYTAPFKSQIPECLSNGYCKIIFLIRLPHAFKIVKYECQMARMLTSSVYRLTEM